MKIYLASSTSNGRLDEVIEALTNMDHEVYDFRKCEFSWGDAGLSTDENPPIREFFKAIDSDAAEIAHLENLNALEECEAIVLILPCGRSAHYELGYAAAFNTPTFILIDEMAEWKAELVYRETRNVCTEVSELVEQIKGHGF